MTSFTTDLGRRWPLLVVAIVLIGGGIGVHSDAGGRDRVLATVFAVVAVAGIAATLFRPRIGMLVAGAAAGVYFAASLHPGPMFLTIPVACGMAALRLRPRELVPPAVTSLAMLGGGLALGDSVGVWPVLGTSAMTAAATMLVWWFLARNEAADQASRRAASDEQLRMAQELHDGVGHGLAVIAMQAGAALHLLEKDPAAGPAVRSNLQAIRDTSREALDALRAELTRLASPETAPRTPSVGLADLPALVDRVRSGGLAVSFTDSSHEAPGLDQVVGQVAYGVVQEALTNVLRHAAATRAAVVLARQDGALAVTVTDDGTNQGPVVEGMGLRGMRRRVQALGGRLTVGPSGDGFRVHAELPLRGLPT